MRFPISKSFPRSLFIAALAVTGSTYAVTPTDLAARLARNERLLIVDVRATMAYSQEHIPGAINIPASLLPHKQLPAGQTVVVYGDGLGVVDEAQVLSVVRAKPGINAELLEGGYAAWLTETRLTTVMAGISREKIPGITYQQLVAAGKADLVLVDLREPVSATAAAAKSGRPAKAALATDLLTDFANKLGVPVMSRPGEVNSSANTAATAGSPARAAAAIPAVPDSKLLVLVADNEAAASEVARQLRASGHYRFTVLIGGTEIIRHEGKQGTGRMDGDLPVTKSQP